MKTLKLLAWAIWHLCTTSFIEFVELIKGIRWLDEQEKKRRRRLP